MSTFGLRCREVGRKRYVARDRNRRGKAEHAVWNHVNNEVMWSPHPQGGKMIPFEGPDEVWKNLIQGALRY